MLESMDEREEALMAFLGEGLEINDVRLATEIVRHVRGKLEGPDWLEVIEKP